MTTYYARVDYSYSGDSKFTIPFSYIKKEHIVVLVNDVKTTNYTYITSSQIEVKDELQAGDVVSIRRTTPIKDKLVSFTDLNILNGEIQNLAQEQVFNAVQEMYDDNTQFKIDTENNILQNRTEIDAQIEANNQELLNIQSSFESEVNTTIETVREAAEKINNLEQAVTTATSAATTANNAANTASAAAESATSAAATATAKAEEVSQALVTKEDKTNKGVANGYAGLDADGKVPTAQLPNIGLEICDIGMALYVDETKGKRRYLNGQIVDINTNTQAFLNRLQQITTLHPSLLCTEEEWQTAKTSSAFEQVGKFVFNYNGADIVSVRIPRVVNVQGLFDLQNLGMTVKAGLPNIIGNFDGINGVGHTSGCFYRGQAAKSPAANGDGDNFVNFDASRSSTVYGNSTTVQPEAIQYPYFIQIATGSETENNIINDIELNNPYSLFDSKYSDHELNNLSWLKSEGQWNAKAVYTDAYDKLLKVYNGTETVEGLSVKLSTETYTDYDFVLNTADETFRLPIKNGREGIFASGYKWSAKISKSLNITYTAETNGFIVYTGRVTGAEAGESKLYINNSIVAVDRHDKDDDEGHFYVPVNKGDTYKITDNIGMQYYYFVPVVPVVSNAYLYFYVGETVQNANLIDAGRIGEQLASLTTVVETYQNGTSWYRVWSDGWCEQGGYSTSSNVTITLLKTYANTNYTITLGKAFKNETNTRIPNIVSTTKTTAQFKVTGTYNNTAGTDCYFYWETKGYMA